MNRARLSHPQRGNALIFTLLALVITALGVAGYLSSKQMEMKTQAGLTEATVLEMLRNAANNAISDNVANIQEGLPMSKDVGGTVLTVPGVDLPGGERVWSPTPLQLSAMGYLPAGWNTTTSSLNGGTYSISLRRTPPGCVLLNCNIEGAVVLPLPINDPDSGRSDGVVIGAILTKMGADSAVSLTLPSPLDSTVLTGYGPGGTWSMPNPVAGTPPGVVAVRIGTASSAFASFVRVGDLRDPNLRGDLTVARNLAIRGSTALDGPVTLNDSPLTVRNATAPCTTITAGVVQIGCEGQVNASVGTFGTRVVTNTVETTDIGEFSIRGPGGQRMRVNNLGDLTAEGTVTGDLLQLTSPVAEGALCLSGAIAALQGGGIAVCSPRGTFVSAVRYGVNKEFCAGEGLQATDLDAGEGLVCRNGRWAVASSLTSDFVFMGSFLVSNGSNLDMPTCRDTGVSPPLPMLYLTPANEQTAPVLNRSATQGGNRVNNGSGYFQGGSWLISLTNGSGLPISENSAIASVYCLYNF